MKKSLFSRFFIERPIFASVISILMMAAGIVAMRHLPIEQYPNIAPPQIGVHASYPGASAKVVADTVAAPLENVINGVEGMSYMSSTSSSSGAMDLLITFDLGTDADMARVKVQNRVDTALPLLPDDIKRQGVRVYKSTPNFMLVVAIQATEGTFDPLYVNNFATIVVADALRRVKGVRKADVFGAENYSMRIWLKPDIMAEIGVTTNDIVKAIQEQNNEYPIGQFGSQPSPKFIELTVPVNTQGRLNEPSQYEEIIIKSNRNGGVLKLKDIARVELGSQNYNMLGLLKQTPTAMISVYQQFGADAIEVANEVKKTLEELKVSFPAGIGYSIPYDTTLFMRESIKEVVRTVIQAAILVTIVVFVFLQNWRVALIPLLAMVISIISTFGGMYLLGFSINTLTLFGMVLAIGIVVDDAIVVVENIERNMRELGLSAKESAFKAMREVTAPIIAIVFVLCAVFVPVAFMGGIAGELYKQFAFTITLSMVVSGIVALTLSPALASLLLVHSHKEKEISRKFHASFSKVTAYFIKGAEWLIVRRVIALVVFVVVVAGIVVFYRTLPQSFVPQEDQGYFISVATLPDAATLPRTEAVTRKYVDIVLKNPYIQDVFTLSGYSILEGERPRSGTYFPILKPWKERKTKAAKVQNVIASLNKELENIPEAVIISFNPPAIRGLGSVGGLEGYILDRTGGSQDALEAVTKEFIAAAKKRSEIAEVTTTMESNSLQLTLQLDKVKAKAYDVEISEIFSTLQTLLGTYYVNDFNKFGKVYEVVLQAKPEFRESIKDIERMYVKSTKGDMIPLSSFLTLEFTQAPYSISRYNGFNAAQVNANIALRYSTGQAMAALNQVAGQVLPNGMTFVWSGSALQEQKAGGSSSAILLAGLFVVFFILAALYEKWALPVAILLIVPFGILGAFVAIWIRGIDNDIYFQIGLVALIALAAKNAILIVEFANIKRKEGLDIQKAALESARMRFRAIVMTSLTFIAGVLPLVFSSGAGANSRHSVGTGVLGGMLFATLFGVLFVPLFYTIFHGNKRESDEEI